MATDQGKTSNVDRPGADGRAHRQDHPADRHDDLPPALRAGRDRRASPAHHRGKDFRPTRLPPSHQWAREQGAVFVETRRLAARAVVSAAPARPTGSRASTARSGRCARASACAMSRRSARSTCRARTPPSSSTALYTNTLTTLAVGKARYGLMLREDGFVLDDGTTSRLAEDRFIVTTTTANAGQGAAAHGVLPPVAVAGARRAALLGERAMGAVLDRRPALARRACARSSIASTTSRTRPSRTWRRPS